MDFFKLLPKGSDLHTHFSSLVDYYQIFDKIEEKNLHKYLYFNLEKNLLFFDFQRNEDYLCFYEKKQDIIKLIQNFIFYKTQLVQDNCQKSFKEYKILGDLMYGIIKHKKFYKYYVKLIYKNMEKQNYLILETSFDNDKDIVDSLDLVEYINKQNKKKKKNIKIILQFSRANENLQKEVIQGLEFIKKQKYFLIFLSFKDLFIGLDFTGYEKNLINKNVMEDQNILSMMKLLNLQFYNHSGEFIIKDQYLQNFDFSQNVNFLNCQYIIQHQKQFKDIYNKVIRVGHGLIYLQYLYKNNLKQGNKKLFIDDLVFEICPYSNIHFYDGQLQKEIYEKFQNQIVICTDDENKINKNLSECYQLLSEFLNIETLYKFILNGIKFSSLQDEEKRQCLKKTELDIEKFKKENQNYKKIQKKNSPWWKINQEQFNIQKKIFFQYKTNSFQNKKVKRY